MYRVIVAALFALVFAVPVSATAASGTTIDSAPAATAEKTEAEAVVAVVAADGPKTAPKITNPQVLIKTSMGEITVELFARESPKTVANFLQYVDAEFYDGTIFHRVIAGFMIQGGGFDATMKQKPTLASVENEAINALKNLRGTLAMARTNDPNSATSQFFINVADNASLDFVSPADGRTWGYAVFGKVTAGMEVVDAIRAVPTGMAGGMGDVPTTPVEITAISRID